MGDIDLAPISRDVKILNRSERVKHWVDLAGYRALGAPPFCGNHRLVDPLRGRSRSIIAGSRDFEGSFPDLEAKIGSKGLSTGCIWRGVEPCQCCHLVAHVGSLIP